jgi:hypothetical protein
LALFVASAVAYYILMAYYGYTMFTGLPVMAVPFCVIGVINHILNRNFIMLMIIVAASVITFFLLPAAFLFVIYILVCSEGLASVVELIQRAIFYRVMGDVEYMNVKDRLNFRERLIRFFFNIPQDIDTRRLTMDLHISRSKFPWRDTVNSFMIVLIFEMFLWIYLFINPNISVQTEGVPIYTFTIVLYILVLVMPWSIFNTVKARIASDYRDYSLYNGLMGTFVRMFIPLFIVLLFLFVLASGLKELDYVALSLVLTLVMLLSASAMYFTWNEINLINDIADQWGRFRPIELYSRFMADELHTSRDDDVPGTPIRDPSDCFRPDVKSRVR